jgi:hypothetical protein
VILARLGEYDLAKRNLRSLFAMQEENELGLQRIIGARDFTWSALLVDMPA